MGNLIKGKCLTCGGELVAHWGSIKSRVPDDIRCLKCGRSLNGKRKATVREKAEALFRGELRNDVGKTANLEFLG